MNDIISVIGMFDTEMTFNLVITNSDKLLAEKYYNKKIFILSRNRHPQIFSYINS